VKLGALAQLVIEPLWRKKAMSFFLGLFVGRKMLFERSLPRASDCPIWNEIDKIELSESTRI
jgi:hypothetical protein